MRRGPHASDEGSAAVTSEPVRSILHIDMDAFFASVELIRRPELTGRPVAVGGTGDRGVVAAASYEARAYGVHSAMPSARARRMCPDLVLLPGDHAHYAEVSGRIMEIFRSVTPLVEPLSLDEAFLDVTGTRRLMGEATSIAHELRRRVLDEEGLRCAVGVAANKFLAKLASAQAKPTVGPDGPCPGAGVLVVGPGEELGFLHPLDVSRLWGVGPATLARLRAVGVRTVGELAALDRATVVGLLGAGTGGHLHSLANGLDDRPVEPDRAPRSVSHEETFAADRHHTDELRGDLVRMADAVATRLRAHGSRGRTIQVKVRFGDFTTVSRSRTLDVPTDSGPTLRDVAWELLSGLPVSRGVRLLGLGASNLVTGDAAEQLSFDLTVRRPVEPDRSVRSGSVPGGSVPTSEDREAVDAAVDAIRRRFGSRSIGPGRLVGGGPTPGSRRWGPDRDGPPSTGG